MRYLSTSHIPDDIWGRLQRRLVDTLKHRRAFVSLDEEEYSPRYLRIVPTSLRDHSGEPLLPNCTCADHSCRYLSEIYDRDLDLPILQHIGVETLSIQEFINRVECDLKDDESRMRTTPVESAWHTKIAKVLTKAMDVPENWNRISRLPLIPLTKGTWVRPLNASIFFPTCRGTDIPSDLPLNLVDPQTLENQARETLFKRLGISECHPERIFPLIEQACKSNNWTLAAAVQHLKFVFWNHDELPPQDISIMAVSMDNVKFWPRTPSAGWIYRPNATGPYCAATVIGHPIPEELRSNMHFLHPQYYEVLSSCERRRDKTGTEWLQNFLRIKTAPQLQRRDDLRKVSSEVQYIARRKPHLLLGVLKQQWSNIRNAADWQKEFAELNVRIPVLRSEINRPLQSTYLPLPKLRSIVARLDLENDFGFVKELEEMCDYEAIGWNFISHFGVGVEEDFTFWVLMLRKAMEKEELDIKVASEIYLQLQNRCITERDQKALRYR